MDIPTTAQWFIAALVILGIITTGTVLMTVYDAAKEAKTYFERENAKHRDNET